MGSRALEQRLSQALEVLSDMGIRIPETGRHRKAIALLRRWNDSKDDLDLSETTLDRMAAATRTAWETFVIALAAERHKKKWRDREDLFTSERISTMMRGPELNEGSDTSARDAQFEMYIGAEFELASLDVRGGEPDLRFQYGQEWVGVAAKRVSSLAPKQMQTHLNKAVRQIERSGLRGWIAVNIDSRFQDVKLGGPTEDLLTEFGLIFDQVQYALEPHWNNDAVLGVLAFGHVTAWILPEASGHLPRITTALPFRWVRWTDEAGAELLHDQFARGYLDRVRTRRRVLTNPDFEGVL